MMIARFLIALSTAMSSVGFSVSAYADQETHKKTISSTFPEARPLVDSSQSHPHFGIKGGFSNPEGSGLASRRALFFALMVRTLAMRQC